MKITVVIPIYNESKYIGSVVAGVKKYKIPIVLVDDGSDDFDKVGDFGDNVALVRHKVNLGKGAAMKTGAEYALNRGSDAVIFMDADGQHSPKDLTRFVEKLKSSKYDVILGYRNLSHGAPFVRYFGNKVASLVIKMLFGINVSDPLSGYRAMTKSAFEIIKWESSGYSVESEILARVAKNKLKFTEIPIETIYHDVDKGVSVLDAFGVMLDVLKWRLSP